MTADRFRVGTVMALFASFLFPTLPLAHAAPQEAKPSRPAAATSTISDASRAEGLRLRALLDEEWTVRLRENPLDATQNGVRDHDDRLPSVAPEDYRRRLQFDQDFARRLSQVNRSALSPQDQVNLDLVQFVLRHRIALAAFRDYRIPLTSDSGFHVDIMRMGVGVRMRDARDYENYIARLRAVAGYLEQNVANMRQGISDGFTLPGAILPGILSVIEGQQFQSPDDTPFFEPLLTFPDSVGKAERERLRASAREVIRTAVIPAYTKLRTFFVDEYAPAARRTIGATQLPEGKPYYEALVKFYTNLEVTPQQVHDTGLREVARIRARMDSAMRRSGFKGDFPAFLEFLRTDPQFYAKTPLELLKEASYLSKKIDGMLPAYFGKLPRMPYSVQPVPAVLAPNYTGGRYSPPPIGGTKGGEYWVNTYALDKRPLYQLPALTLHEAVPGHHLQGSLARELTDVPPFRLDLYPHAFGEGWGLYSEFLGEEMGIYETPYTEFGRLSYEMWRACRLVVDTGMHAMGWSRERALEYVGTQTALSQQEVRTEVDRYIAWPGQALAYKMGELKIIELRRRAEKELGARFDIREFHDAVHENGGVPLPVLEQQIDRYIARKR
jgi:uncharacterized protein (DUF885 family)